MIYGSANLAGSSFLRILMHLRMHSLRVVLPSRIADGRVMFFLNISFWLMFSFMLSCYNFQYAYEIVCYTANCAMSQTWWHVRRVLTVQPYWGYDLKSFKLFFLLSLHKIELQLQFITSFKCQLKIVYTSYIAPVHLKNGLSNKTYELTRH